MEATELRIGNFIYGYTYNDEDEETECLVKVVALDHADITDYRIWVEGFSSKDDHEYYGAFNPIPLTEEWFLKLGFRKHMGGFAKNILFFEEFEEGYDLMNIDALDFSFKYVHQLQNLFFTLTGEELTLK